MASASCFPTPSFRLGLLACLCCAAAGHADLGHGQGYDSWSKVEQSEETRTYSQQLGEGTFEAPQKNVLEKVILSQLEKPANRSTIAQVRQRMRDIITRGTTNPKIFDAVNATTADTMARLVADADQDIVVRVNAIGLLGDLIAADRKAWPGSIKPLAQAAGDEKLPLAVRVAAMAGLVRQVNAGRGSDPAFAEAVGPVVTAIITKPPEGDPRAVAWLLGRCLDLAPVVASTPAVTKAAAKTLADEKADLDLRIRAAMALGRLAKPGPAPDLAAAVAHIRGLAVKALASDLAEAESRRFAKQLGSYGNKGATGMAPELAPPPPPAAPAVGGGLLGGGFFGGEPGAGAIGGAGEPLQVVDPDAVPRTACRRNAWRLVSLADALQPEASKVAGIASGLTGDPAAEAIELATVLREQGLAIETALDESSVKAALAAIEARAMPGEPQAPGAAPAAPAPPTTQPADSPFGGPGASSPF